MKNLKLAYTKFQRGYSLTLKQHYLSAINYFQFAREIAELEMNANLLVVSTYNIGFSFGKEKQYKPAIRYLNMAKALYTKNMDVEGQRNSVYLLGLYHK